MTLGESLYYAVREDFNCRLDPAYREPDSKILPALDMLAARSGPDGLAPVEIEAFCRAIERRGRTRELERIPWLKLRQGEADCCGDPGDNRRD